MRVTEIPWALGPMNLFRRGGYLRALGSSKVRRDCARSVATRCPLRQLDMHSLLRHSLLLALAALIASANLYAASGTNATVRGYWVVPSGSIIHIAPCGTRLCLDIVALSREARATTDVHNPNPSLRMRPLCGLRIGQGFIERDPQHAEGGQIYDPKSGRTYRGSMTADGDLLNLRGYVGIKLFGRTETWKRFHGAPGPCGAH